MLSGGAHDTIRGCARCTAPNLSIYFSLVPVSFLGLHGSVISAKRPQTLGICIAYVIYIGDRRPLPLLLRQQLLHLPLCLLLALPPTLPLALRTPLPLTAPVPLYL